VNSKEENTFYTLLHPWTYPCTTFY